MDEGKKRIQAERGVRAKALLENQLLQEAFTFIESALMEDWKNTNAEDRQRRDDAWRSYKLLKNLQSYLARVVTTGEAASKELLQVKNPSIFNRRR